MISPVCLVFSKRFFASTGHSRARAAYYLGVNVALLAQNMYSIVIYIYHILMYIYHILMYTIMKDKQWVCTFADHWVTETIMGDKCSTTCCHHSGWAVSNSYMLHNMLLLLLLQICYCLYRDHHRGWAAILSGDQLTAGVQAEQSSCSLWWSGCNATTPTIITCYNLLQPSV